VEKGRQVRREKVAELGQRQEWERQVGRRGEQAEKQAWEREGERRAE
jgi:hypothetical protein